MTVKVKRFRLSSPAIYVIFLLVLSFLGVLGNTLVLLVHQHDQDYPPMPEGYHGNSHAVESHDNSSSLLGSEQSPEKQLSHSRLLNTTPTGQNNVSSVQTSNLCDRYQNTRQELSSAHVSVILRSRASRLNHAMLIASAVSLFGCTAAVFVLITT